MAPPQPHIFCASSRHPRSKSTIRPAASGTQALSKPAASLRAPDTVRLSEDGNAQPAAKGQDCCALETLIY